MKHHRESEMQIKCVSWFHYQYPAYTRLLEHPKNEEKNSTIRQIAKAESVQPGVADLILHVPAYITDASLRHSDCYHSLAIEMKTKVGRQSPEQKHWQKLFEAAGGKYIVVRSFEEFTETIKTYMANVPLDVDEAVKKVYADYEKELTEQSVRKFKKLIGK